MELGFSQEEFVAFSAASDRFTAIEMIKCNSPKFFELFWTAPQEVLWLQNGSCAQPQIVNNIWSLPNVVPKPWEIKLVSLKFRLGLKFKSSFGGRRAVILSALPTTVLRLQIRGSVVHASLFTYSFTQFLCSLLLLWWLPSCPNWRIFVAKGLFLNVARGFVKYETGEVCLQICFALVCDGDHSVIKRTSLGR